MTARHPGTVGQCRLACASGLATLLAFGMFGTARAQGVITSTRDSSGVRITSSDVSGAPTWILSPEPALQVGVIDGDHPYRFDRIEAAFRLGDGRLVVADRGSNELRFFSSSGKHVRTVGRRGAGPGEFEVLTAVVKLPGDSLLVHDIRNRRLTLISPEGTISHEAVNAEVPFLRAGSLLGTVSDGRLLFRLTPPLVVGHNQGFRRDTVLVATARRGDSALDTLIRLPSAERFRRGAVTHVHPFGHNAVAAAWNGEIVVGTGETHELRILDSVGHLSAIMRRSDVPRLPLSRAVVAVYLEEIERQSGARAAASAQEVMDLFPGPRFLPAYAVLLVDDVGMCGSGTRSRRGWRRTRSSVAGRSSIAVVEYELARRLHAASSLCISARNLSSGAVETKTMSSSCRYSHCAVLAPERVGHGCDDVGASIFE